MVQLAREGLGMLAALRKKCHRRLYTECCADRRRRTPCHRTPCREAPQKRGAKRRLSYSMPGEGLRMLERSAAEYLAPECLAERCRKEKA